MVEKKVSLIELENNPNVGLYVFANDKFCIVGKEIDEKKRKDIENILNVPIYSATILGTDLVGVFISGNNDFILIPNAYEHEIEMFEKICKDHDVKLNIIDEKMNTFGNNLCISDKLIVANPKYPKAFFDKLKKKTRLEVFKLENKEFESAGAVCRFVAGKYFVSQQLSEEEVDKFINEIGGIGTVNSGSNYVSSGIVGNKNGLLIGSASSTIEIQNIVESLNFL